MIDRADTDRRLEVLGQAVRRRRRDLNLRQDEVAVLAGCSERFVHTLENAKATVRLDKVLDVLEVLGLGLVVGPGQGEVRPGGAEPSDTRPTGG